MINPTSGLLVLMPSGPLRVGLLGAVLMGVIGSVIGLITSAIGLSMPLAAAVGILTFVLLKRRGSFSEVVSLANAIHGYLEGGRLNRRKVLMDLFLATWALDFAIVGVSVAMF